MTIQPTVTIDGVIKLDGSLEVVLPQGLRAGPVRISREHLEPNSKKEPAPFQPGVAVRLPDPPISDTAISAPCDLPRQGPFRRITPRRVEGRLPDPHDIDDTTE